jgi:oligopeptide/dipeptide ABC transporter ATP-binding protein
MAVVLDIEEISIDYSVAGGTLHAVREVSLAIEAGKTLGLVGESGSGKTSLGLAISRLLPPKASITGGAIRLGGLDLLGLPAQEIRELRGSRIAMVFQDPMNALNPVLSIGAQMIDIQFRDRTRSRREKREHAIAMLRRVGIPDPERRFYDYPHQFSGGMRQRIAIAMALSGRPDLLIADEPTTALDVTLEAQILDLLRDLRRDFCGATLIITHNLAVVAELCDEVAVMYAGEILEQGPVGAVFAHPLHPYTRALLACDPGRLAVSTRVFPTIGGQLPDLRAVSVSCLFAPRCSHAFARCRREVPPAIEAAPGRRTKCFLAVND